MSFAIPVPEPVALDIAGTQSKFPVRRVYCVGRNYAAHAREMGFDDRELPFFFCKPADALVQVGAEGASIAYPPESSDYQHEIELVVAIGIRGSDISATAALAHVWGYAVGLDMTRRDVQKRLRDKGHPWEMGKAFDQSAPIGPIHAAADVGHLAQGAIWLEVDGGDRQRGDVGDMIWSVAEVIAALSRYVELVPGDLIFTGTPEGVGKVERGQTMRGGITGLGEISVCVSA